MEAVEDKWETPMGTSKVRSSDVDGKTVSRIWRPLSSGCQNHRTTSHKQRNPRKARTSKLFGLLFELNRCMPNGTYSGVRGATC